MSQVKVIQVKDLKKEYFLGETKVEALKGVSFEVETGEFLAISGPSGSGKSTILNMLGCIDNPTSGEVFINGREVSKLSDTELTRYRRVNISFIFQSFNLIPVLNVYENIELPLLLQKINNAELRRERVMKFVKEVGLEDRLKNKPNELSGGQRQRVAIARALVIDPLLVLADEPTANLDSKTGGKILELMQEINEKDGTTFIFSTHDKHIMDHAKRILSIQDGLIEGEFRKGN